MKPPFNYFGSKARVADKILQLVPDECRTWLELFAGTAIVTLNKPRHPREHINDLSGDVVNLFRVARDPDLRARLESMLDLTPYAQGEFEACMSDRETPEDPVERARRFLVRTWMGRSGAVRHRTGFRWSKNQNTAPERTWATINDRIRAVGERLQGVCIWECDALALLRRFESSSSTIIFIDPPYPAHTVGWKARYEHIMTREQHQELAEAMARAKAKIILTMNPGTIYDEALAGWRSFPIAIHNSWNTVKDERVFLNYDPPPSSLFHQVDAAEAVAE